MVEPTPEKGPLRIPGKRAWGPGAPGKRQPLAQRISFFSEVDARAIRGAAAFARRPRSDTAAGVDIAEQCNPGQFAPAPALSGRRNDDRADGLLRQRDVVEHF